ncbi:hypothetical protein DRF65_16110 [Chryseobacterium pennae]|uniref:Uncharacterized protein n=1 Tax=Chryseobacterium pennae TaxID=2258962 RepID=A0A3D9C6F3_9FLAO|nr:hypothetical protein [Chryseobacterium pennae]REC61460.1 hypothetical protein DRF65_16110 [Chryseobacterium pennae]
MGNKIITEKDFWVCSGGLMPTQFQSRQPSTKRKDGAKYITKADTATVSFADFSCKKLMLIMAILAALIAVATVATGGAALIAIGAIAGAAGAAFGAVLGSLLCGQMVAKVRKWDAGKEDMKIMGIPAITGDYQMTCPLFGDKIVFAPEIKTWGQALAIGGANLIGGIMEGMLAGALVGVGGAAIGGGRAALTSGGVRGLGQAGLNFLKTIPSNIGRNYLASWTTPTGLGIRGLITAQSGLSQYGEAGVLNGDTLQALGTGIFGMEIGTANAAYNVATGQAKWEDFGCLALWMVPIAGAKPKNGSAYEGGNSAPKRPSWRQSEIDAAKKYPKYGEQRSFKGGKDVELMTKGSTRPDLYRDGGIIRKPHSIEVKNYDISSNKGRNSLKKELVRQYNQRINDLPPGTKQTAIIDIRGQNVSKETLNGLKNDILKEAPNYKIIFETGKGSKNGGIVFPPQNEK